MADGSLSSEGLHYPEQHGEDYVHPNDLPADFDPTSDEQVRLLSGGQLRSCVAGAVCAILEGGGDTSDLAYALFPPEDDDFIDPDATPEQLTLANALLRELVRRAVRQNPKLNLTQEYLFGEEG